MPRLWRILLSPRGRGAIRPGASRSTHTPAPWARVSPSPTSGEGLNSPDADEASGVAVEGFEVAAEAAVAARRQPPWSRRQRAAGRRRLKTHNAARPRKRESRHADAEDRERRDRGGERAGRGP